MIPTFKPGDHVLTFNWIIPRKGDVIVFRLSGRNFIKRVNKVEGKSFVCIGDNRNNSGKLYRVVANGIIGKVIFKY